ncbi:hypothetical protein CK203_078093 [Vitis vinifera]|uniref:Uncharacterized protein n=1 Tax=Vitis vinifera TaxID=29760 RepID=A0A438ETQ6_VITVI|nr:hypothetical protein CK203_078093 [Vitis vinifera]
MPASPSDARTKWRKRKRDPHVSRRQKHEEDEEDDDDVDDELDADADDDNEQQPQHGPQSGAVPDPAPLDKGGAFRWRRSNFRLP